MVAVLTVAPIGGTIPIAAGVNDVFLQTPESPALYFLFAQASTPITVWQEGFTDTFFTVGLGATAPLGLELTYLAVSREDPNVGSVVVDAGSNVVGIPVDGTINAVFVMPTWNTTVWFSDANTGGTIINFGTPPSADSFLYYIYTSSPKQGIALTEPVKTGAISAAFSLVTGSSYAPFALASWNTAVGNDVNAGGTILGFSTPVPAGGQIMAFTNFIEAPAPGIFTPSVPQQQPFAPAVLDANDLVLRLFRLFPYPWAMQMPGTITYALMFSFAVNFAYISAQIQYAWSACRLATADMSALILFSKDYFGNTLPPAPGENPDHFRQRIQTLLLQPRVTRQAIINALLFLTGAKARLIEPWNPAQTGYYGTSPPFIGSYNDFDSEEVPSLWGNPGARYQGWMQVQLPPAVGPGINIYGFDAGAAYDTFFGIEWDTTDQFSLQPLVVEQIIAYLIAEGTTVWVQFVNNITAPGAIGASIFVATGMVKIVLSINFAAGLYTIYAQLSLPIPIWNTARSTQGFTLTTQAPTSRGTVLNYLAVENGSPNSVTTSVPGGATTLALDVDNIHNAVFVQPTWETAVSYQNRGSTAVEILFTNPPASAAYLNYLILPIGIACGFFDIPANAVTAVIVVQNDSGHIPFVMANWATTVGVLPSTTQGTILLTFENPAPSDGTGEVQFMSYAIQDQAPPIVLSSEAPFGALNVVTGATEVNVLIGQPASNYFMFAQLSTPAAVWVRSALDNTFSFLLQQAAPLGLILFYLGLLTSNPQTGFLTVSGSSITASLSLDALINVVFPQPTWNTDVFYSDRTSSNLTFNFPYGAPGSQDLDYFTIPTSPGAGYIAIEAESQGIQVVIPTDENHIPLVTANWATHIGVSATNSALGYIVLTFENTAPIDGSGEIALISYNVTKPNGAEPTSSIPASGLLPLASFITQVCIRLFDPVSDYIYFAQLSVPQNVWLSGTQDYGGTFSLQRRTGGDSVQLNYAILPLASTGANTHLVTAHSTSLTLTLDNAANALIACPNWNTSLYYTERSNAAVKIVFTTAPDVDSVLSYILLPLGSTSIIESVAGNATSLTISFVLDSTHIPFAITNWETPVGITTDLVAQTITIHFANPAPGDNSGEVQIIVYPV